MKEQFIKPENDKDVNPVEYFNNHKTWVNVFESVKSVDWINDKSLSCGQGKDVCFEIKSDLLHVIKENKIGLTVGKKYSKFQAFSRIRFKGNYIACQTYISMTWLNHNIPFIRVGTDYFKVITKTDRYGVDRKVIKGWRKDEIKQDHGVELLKHISRFDDFCIVPDNVNYQLVVNNCYNLYAPFSHDPYKKKVNESDFPISYKLIQHIFGEQIALGLTFLKVLYLHPDRPLPILCLVSKERQTGKTTFLNWMQMIFGDNFIQINPEDLSSQFNSSYASKNIIALDETVIEKSHAVEKLKSIATAKSLSVNQKFVANYALPFYGKVILCTNKEKDFMRIDEEEIRFWVRKVKTIESINTKIEYQLKDEIPYFLKYLADLPAVDFSRSRMVFTAEQLKNEQLKSIQEESWSGVRKELFMYFEDLFIKNEHLKEAKCTAQDIKNRWFLHNNQVNSPYIMKVLMQEMGLKQEKLQRYSVLESDPLVKVRGRVFTFKRADFLVDAEIESEIPF